eukprot:CAMPEP_0113944082 /NCGR_PEP_ID=MMETSP1339-20121228/30625_1 /TAXON_ID=94617 /ORGANISM="Fibrocapsa japonica" /LENGTH=254 /DNA_ID=CAMNT_0000949149 /DNA_START=65 /DNA_END=826 /DNA_ORIENTATION=+ /assembly_acc=CAM_ASM_000762
MKAFLPALLSWALALALPYHVNGFSFAGRAYAPIPARLPSVSKSLTRSHQDFQLRMVLGFGSKKSVATLESDLLDAISSATEGGRVSSDLEKVAAVTAAVEALEADGGIARPVDSPLINGKWRLLFTTTEGTASPIQRTFVGTDAFSVFQEIALDEDSPTVTNVVDFGESVGALRVAALASTESQPLPGFVPRKGDGKILGLNIFGVSSTREPEKPGQRIDFKFDDAAFKFQSLPFRIPYPVPFRYLGDEVKGW